MTSGEEDSGIFRDRRPTMRTSEQHPTPRFADVAVAEPVHNAFTYLVPEQWASIIAPGQLVAVPFGRRITTGCVVGLSASPPSLSLEKILPISRVLSPEFRLDDESIGLARWLSEYYMAPFGECLACVSLIGFNDVRPKSRRALILASGFSQEAEASELTRRQRLVIDALRSAGRPVPATELRRQAGVSQAVIDRLLERGILAWVHEKVERDDEYGYPVESDHPLELNGAQTKALQAIAEALERGEATTFVLHGVTGSGKTEVYLQAIARTLEAGGSAIVLVPEISLTPQIVDRFRRRFGEITGVYHSRLTMGQKYDLWERIRSGACRILVGARSAVFAPMPDLKILIVDEEHEPSYKQDCSPRYHARDVAIVRAHRCRAVVVLGSATPNVESYFKAQQGKFRLLSLPERIDNRLLPTIEIVDLVQKTRENLELSIFCSETIDRMRRTLEAGNQVLVFLNRRGFFNFAICLECKRVVSCKRCDIALTYHKIGDRLLCHYCGFSLRRLAACPACGSNELSMVGLGTQRVEEELATLFPEKRVVRVDLDTMRERTAYLDMWKRIAERDVDIIVGTQMIAKGLHLEGIALVVVPLADVSLFQPDFRSAERAFALLTQVAGRAGRGQVPGHVLIQTYVPYHYAIQYAREHDYVGFFRKEIHVRKILRFPPFQRLVGILGLCRNQALGEELFSTFTQHLSHVAFPHRDSVSVLGPTPAPLFRLEGTYRWRALLRGSSPPLLRSLVQQALTRFACEPKHSRLQIVVDVDPYDLT